MIIGAIMSAISGGKITASGIMGGIQNDIYNTINFKNLPAKTAARHMAKTKATMERNAREAAYYAGNDKPRQAARPVGQAAQPVGPPPPPPIKTVDQFYAELSNKHLWGALPSLRMERGDSTAPRYGNVDLQQREGGVARSLFNPYGE